MKKATLLAIVIAICLSGYSQNLFGIFAGAQTSTAKYTVADIKQPTEYKYGFNAGICLKIPFDVNLFFSPAIFYSLKGYKVTLNQHVYPPDTAAINNNTTMHTVEVAPLLQYDFGKEPSHFFIKAGPSVDFQVGGKETFQLKTGGSVERQMPFGFTAYGHYSVNLLFQFGYETKSGIMIFGQLTDGLANINNADGGPTIKHKAFGLTVGKYFTRKKGS